MKRSYTLLLISIQFIMLSCCKKKCETDPNAGPVYELAAQDIPNLFPYTNGDTIRFRRNSQDTIMLVAASAKTTGFNKESTNEPCPRIENLQWIEHKLSGDFCKMIQRAYLLPSYNSRAPQYTVMFNDMIFGPEHPLDVASGKNQVYVLGKLYKEVKNLIAYDTEAIEDTLYYKSGLGVIKILHLGDVYELIPK